MGTVQKKLETLDGYLIRIERNPEIGAYYIVVGIEDGWVYRDTDKIICEEIGSGDGGKLVKISPIDDSIILDDLFLFFEKIIEINIKIIERRKEYEMEMKKMEEMIIEKEATLYDEINQLKDISFDKTPSKPKKNTTVGTKTKNDEVKEETEETKEKEESKVEKKSPKNK